MAQFVFTCPYCKQQFMANDEMVGTVASCTNCGATLTVQKQLTPMDSQNQNQNIAMLILGILGLILWLIPVFSLPVPIVGLIMSYNRGYRLGVILNSVSLGLSALWTVICVLNEM